MCIRGIILPLTEYYKNCTCNKTSNKINDKPVTTIPDFGLAQEACAWYKLVKCHPFPSSGLRQTSKKQKKK